jgi:DnaB-like helicase N terminal domain
MSASRAFTPQSAEAEQAVLGSVLIDAGAFPRIASMLAEDDFYRPDHRLIYGAITSLARNGSPPDAVTIFEELKRQGKDGDMGGLVYLSTLARETSTSANVESYAAIVRERAIARGIIETADRIAAGVMNRKLRSPTCSPMPSGNSHSSGGNAPALLASACSLWRLATFSLWKFRRGSTCCIPSSRSRGL